MLQHDLAGLYIQQTLANRESTLLTIWFFCLDSLSAFSGLLLILSTYISSGYARLLISFCPRSFGWALPIDVFFPMLSLLELINYNMQLYQPIEINS